MSDTCKDGDRFTGQSVNKIDYIIVAKKIL